MRKILLAFLLFSQAASAQLTVVDNREREIGKASRSFEAFAWLTESITGTDTTYLLKFQNSKYTRIADVRSVTFRGSATVQELYKALSAAMVKNKGELTTFVLGESAVQVNTGKVMGGKYIQIVTAVGTFSLTDGQLRKLFGKK